MKNAYGMFVLAGVLAVAATGCDDKGKAGKDDTAKAADKDGDKPAAKKRDNKNDGAKKDDKDGADTKKAKDEKKAKDAVPGLPAEVAGVVKLPEGAAKLKDPSLDLFSFMAAKDMKFAKRTNMMGGRGWIAIEGGDLTFSVMSHNPSGDDGPGCPKMDAMKAKVKGAKVLFDKTFKTETKDNKTLGDEVKLYMFEKDGKVGFYGWKMFDHGDDATTYCAAPGKPSEAKSLSKLVDKAQAEQMAGVFMSLEFAF